MCEEANRRNVVVTTTQPGIYHQASMSCTDCKPLLEHFNASFGLPFAVDRELLTDTTFVPADVFCINHAEPAFYDCSAAL